MSYSLKNENNEPAELIEYSYRNPKQVRIIEACLKGWFSNPKDLNLTDPRMSYPFNIKKWMALSYENENTHAYFLKKNDWIVGMISLRHEPEQNKAHIFHVFVDRVFRSRGYGRRLTDLAEAKALEMGVKQLRLFVLPKNKIAESLYRKRGFKEMGISRNGSLSMIKELN